MGRCALTAEAAGPGRGVDVKGLAEAASRRWSRLLPIEQLLACAAAVAAIVSLVAPVRWCLPNPVAIDMIVDHFIGPITGGILLLGIGTAFTNYRIAWRDLGWYVRTGISFVLVVLLHFNLKLWSGLVNPRRYDEAYALTDEVLSPLVDALRDMASVFAPVLQWSGNPYHDLFVALFLLAFLVSALRGRKVFEATVLATALMLILGGFAYALGPAYGPFTLEHGLDPLATHIQKMMLISYTWYLNSGGDPQLGSMAFVDGVAAMPSLHVGNAVVFTLMAWRASKLSALLFVPATAYLTCQALANAFHYLVDLVAGAALAWLCVIITDRWTRVRPSHIHHDD